MWFRFRSLLRDNPHYTTIAIAGSAIALTSAAAIYVCRFLLNPPTKETLTYASVPPPSSVPVAKPNGPSFLAFGDSITSGTGDDQEPPGYLPVLKSALDQRTGKKWNFSDFSEPGSLPIHLQEKLEGGRYDVLLRRDIGFLCISIGGNSLLKLQRNKGKDQERELKDYIDSLRASLEKIRSLTDAPLYLIGLYNPFPTKSLDENNAVVNRWNLKLENLSNEFTDVVVIPVNDIFRNRRDALARDGIHPSHNGYRDIQMRLLQHLLPRFTPHPTSKEGD
ncbi:GDSL-type esterase/lipase family protein [Pasteuria penetrans]|uniref:GDSL-type esterase/lipase family protein n=1 Tax=Pasteuria penetrans TaxID=86005 RepID=UPI00165A613E|nr:GDSL-type esterase/lipase family protein [Pasteuria penetrans]